MSSNSQNWRFPIISSDPLEWKYDVTEETSAIPFNGYISSSSCNSIVVRTWTNVDIENSRVAVYNCLTQNWWELNVFHSVAGETYDGFTIKHTDKIIVMTVTLIGEPLRSLLRVWSIENRELLHEELIENLLHVFVPRFDDPHLLGIFSAEELQILNFKDETNIEKATIQTRNNQFSSGTMHYPYITQVLYHIGKPSKLQYNCSILVCLKTFWLTASLMAILSL